MNRSLRSLIKRIYNKTTLGRKVASIRKAPRTVLKKITKFGLRKIRKTTPFKKYRRFKRSYLKKHPELKERLTDYGTRIQKTSKNLKLLKRFSERPKETTQAYLTNLIKNELHDSIIAPFIVGLKSEDLNEIFHTEDGHMRTKGAQRGKIKDRLKKDLKDKFKGKFRDYIREKYNIEIEERTITRIIANIIDSAVEVIFAII